MEAAIDRLLGVASSISRVAAWIAGLVLTLAALAITFDISIRYFVNMTIGGGNELAAYALSFATAWGITFTLLHRAHVRIDSLYVHLPPRIRALLDIVGLLSFIGFMSLVVYYGYFVLEQSVISGTVSVSSLEIPLAIPQFFWFVGLLFFMFVAGLLLLRAVIAFVRGDLRKVQSIVGTRSMNEDIEAERESLTGRQAQVDLMKGGAS